MSLDCENILKEAKEEIGNSADSQSLDNARVKYLGRKGLLAGLMSRIPGLPIEERKAYGAAVNACKGQIEELISRKQQALESSFEKSENIDITLPGRQPQKGRMHPVVRAQDEICSVFSHLGFEIFRGPEIETEFNNFEALNIPAEHPSRDAFDTFYIESSSAKESSRLLLRSHTSPSQIRALKACPPPMAVVVPGRVYRPDAVDASHSFMFHQVEGIAVDKDLKFSDLKGVLIAFAKKMFGPDTSMRFRPSFFPFTEPSAEVDISCFACRGKGCSVCKKSGWLEILGCGMVHPHVFSSAGLEPGKWRGFAFGMGVERIAMLKFGVNDIRMFFENDIRFLEQF